MVPPVYPHSPGFSAGVHLQPLSPRIHYEIPALLGGFESHFQFNLSVSLLPTTLICLLLDFQIDYK